MNGTDAAAVRRIRIVGTGRAGGSFALALGRHGWDVGSWDRSHDPRAAAADVDLVLLCVPDDQVAVVAAAIEPNDTAVVAHCAGSLGLEVLDGHRRPATLHPLVSLPSAEIGAERLEGAWFGVSGDPLVVDVVASLGGHSFEVGDEERAAYHAAAVVASNHLVALMGQVERIAEGIGVPPEAFHALAAGSLDNVAGLGAAAALTGPVARGDWSTVRRHLASLDPSERSAYLALVVEAARLVGREVPELGS